MCGAEGVQEVKGFGVCVIIKEMGVRSIPRKWMLSGGVRMIVWGECDRNRCEEVVFWDVIKIMGCARTGDGGFEVSDTRVVVGGRADDKRVKDGGLGGNWNEGRREEDVVYVGIIDSGGDGLGTRMSKGDGGIEGVGRTEEEVKDGVWVGRRG